MTVLDLNTSYYVDFLKEELVKLRDGKFSGNVEFRFNFRDGGVAVMNVSLNKSVKKSKGGE